MKETTYGACMEVFGAEAMFEGQDIATPQLRSNEQDEQSDDTYRQPLQSCKYDSRHN